MIALWIKIIGLGVGLDCESALFVSKITWLFLHLIKFKGHVRNELSQGNLAISIRICFDLLWQLSHTQWRQFFFCLFFLCLMTCS